VGRGSDPRLVAYAGARAMITGGLGLIGSAIARRLVSLGTEVLLVDSMIPDYGGNLANIADIRDRVAVNIADIRGGFALPHLLTGQDFLFNLAAQTSHLDSMSSPEDDLAINCTAQLQLLEACRAVNPGIAIVHAGTRQIYGRPEYLPVDERHPLRPVDVNGVNKMAGEAYHLLYRDVYGIKTRSLRLTNVYGPGMRIKDARQTFLGIWLRRVIEGEPFEVWGGEQRRDLLYVDDAADDTSLSRARSTPLSPAFSTVAPIFSAGRWRFSKQHLRISSGLRMRSASPAGRMPSRSHCAHAGSVRGTSSSPCPTLRLRLLRRSSGPARPRCWSTWSQGPTRWLHASFCVPYSRSRPAGGGGPAGAHLWPAGRIVCPHRDRPEIRLAADRGLCAEPWRIVSGQGGGIVW
jgi:UDP-glucose 4-epimerase